RGKCARCRGGSGRREVRDEEIHFGLKPTVRCSHPVLNACHEKDMPFTLPSCHGPGIYDADRRHVGRDAPHLLSRRHDTAIADGGGGLVVDHASRERRGDAGIVSNAQSHGDAVDRGPSVAAIDTLPRVLVAVAPVISASTVLAMWLPEMAASAPAPLAAIAAPPTSVE